MTDTLLGFSIRASIDAALLAVALGATAASAQDGLGGMLPPAPPPAADAVDPIGDAFKRLTYAEVEDDLSSSPDKALDAIVTRECVSEMRAGDRSWSLDWRKITTVGPGDTFVFVQGPGVQLAIVGDASKPDQAQALSALMMAMQAMRGRCGALERENKPF